MTKETNESIVEKEETTTAVMPEALKDKDTKTTYKKLSNLISQKLDQLKDIATLEILMPVEARMRERLKTLKVLSSAQHLKIRGHWKTTPPQMHVAKLIGKKISNDEYEISFSVYASDAQGRKIIKKHKAIVELANGDKIERTTSAEYIVSHEVIESIKTGKHIKREIITVDA